MTKYRCTPWGHVMLLFVLGAICCAKSDEFAYFDTEDVGKPDSNVPLIRPWKTIFLDAEYAGQWMVAADLDADGEVEIVSAENVNEGDVHYTSAAVAQKLDGSVLWRWGDPDIGRKSWHHDVACQIHDWNGDGRNEVVLCTKGFVVELEGATGRELRRIPIAEDATAGYAMLNHDGSVRWVFESKKVDQSRGHLDCARVVRRGGSAEDFRIVLACCGANNITLVDGNGKTLWEVSGRHFESIDVGRVILNHPGRHIVVDIDHQPYGKSPVWVLDEEGGLLGQVVTDYSRHHGLLDWTGDGIDEILVAHKGGLYNDKGKRIGTFYMPGMETAESKAKYEKSMLIGDMTADGIPDVIIATPHVVHIYRNAHGRKPDRPVPLGTEFNFTLY